MYSISTISTAAINYKMCWFLSKFDRSRLSCSSVYIVIKYLFVFAATTEKLDDWVCYNETLLRTCKPVAQIPQCASPISLYTPFCNRNVHMCAARRQTASDWDVYAYIGKGNGLSPDRHKDITCSKTVILFIGALRTNFSNVLKINIPLMIIGL